jgi:hypothetical protein
MSFFGRAANLIKGSIKLATRPQDDPARERALDEELARDASPSRLSAARGRVRSAPPEAPAPRDPDATPARGAPERDANGEIKRTL